MPPYLAGREEETAEFRKLLEQDTILQNLILSGLRGVGKTVLVETFKPLAFQAGWLWVGTDLSEATTLSEERMAIRLLADLAVVTSGYELQAPLKRAIGFARETERPRLTYDVMAGVFTKAPGLVADKLKAVLELAWQCLRAGNPQGRGVIFVYDEAQNLSNQKANDEFPLSLMLDVFQSLQRRNIPFMLLLAGLPTLFPKLVEARTFAERMFRVRFLNGLGERECRDAILRPLQKSKCGINFDERRIASIIDVSGGYPYFIQFICREVFDAALQQRAAGRRRLHIPVEEILRKLDTDFFAGRWARVTDRQRELLSVIAQIDGSDVEFAVLEVAEKSKQRLETPFSASHVSQMFGSLCDAGLIYKNRHGKYSFAVPLLRRFILRQDTAESSAKKLL